jgi:histidinol-phosphate phosphatase family protein
MNGQRAAFLDRDGTIMRDAAYVRDPNVVELLPGAAAAIRHLNESHVPVIVVTNQSGIARGLMTVAEYGVVRGRLGKLLADEGATITATYMCPHHPDFGHGCDCRKPGLGMYQQAIEEHGLDATRSAFIGDRWRDVGPAAALGGLGILVLSDATPQTDVDRAKTEGVPIVSSLTEAVDLYFATLPG